MNPIALMLSLIGKVLEKLNNPSPRPAQVAKTELKLAETHQQLQSAVNGAFQADLAAFHRFAAPLLLIPNLVSVLGSIELWARTTHQGHLEILNQQSQAINALEGDMVASLEHLHDREAAWKPVRDALEEVPELIETLKRIPGWSGNASANYGTASDGQASASTNLANSVPCMPSAIDRVIQGNKAVALQLNSGLKGSAEIVASTSGAAWMFPRTRATGPALAKTAQMIDAAVGGDMASGFAARINDEANEALGGIADPWPTTA